MDLTATHTFDHPIDQVWAMFGDQAAHVAKFESMGHREIVVDEFDNDGTNVLVKITRLVDVDLPGFAKRVLKPTNTVVSIDRWRDKGDGTYGGTFEADTKGAPIEVTGSTLLRPEGDGTFYEITTQVSVNVPLIGGKLSGFAKGILEQQMRDEFAAGDRWLRS